jgi:hypothetical protein
MYEKKKRFWRRTYGSSHIWAPYMKRRKALTN